MINRYTDKERKTATMKMKTGLDLELRNLLRKELNKLKEYVEIFDCMTAEEKDELREWMAHGKSVNNNPCSLYDEKGNLMDFISAIRVHEDMRRHPENYRTEPDSEFCSDAEFEDLPF